MAQLDKFGIFKTIDALAGGDVLKYEAVLALDVNTIFTKLAYNQEVDAFQDRLNEVLDRDRANARR